MSDELTKRAVVLFGKAAINCPASITGQAAYVALHTKDDDDLFDEFTSLEENENALKAIKFMAESAHKASPNPDATSPLGRGLVREVLSTVTRRVKTYRQLNEEQLKEIVGMYPEYKGEKMDDDKERMYEGAVYTKFIFRSGIES